jgi:hypothetical protein
MPSVGNLFHRRLQGSGLLEDRYDSSYENGKMCDRAKLPGKVLGHFHIASLDPDKRAGLAGSRPFRSDQVCLLESASSGAPR